MFAIVAVFVAGLMVGRTPEYLGKKIEAFEMKMASIAILVPPFMVLGGTALAVLVDAGKAGVANPGRARLLRDPVRVLVGRQQQRQRVCRPVAPTRRSTTRRSGIAMLFSRYWLAIPVLAIAGALAAKKHVPASAPARCRRIRRCSSSC